MWNCILYVLVRLDRVENGVDEDDDDDDDDDDEEEEEEDEE